MAGAFEFTKLVLFSSDISESNSNKATMFALIMSMTLNL